MRILGWLLGKLNGQPVNDEEIETVVDGPKLDRERTRRLEQNEQRAQAAEAQMDVALQELEDSEDEFHEKAASITLSTQSLSEDQIRSILGESK